MKRKMWHFLGQLETLKAVFRHFRNPFTIVLLRLGLIRSTYFFYEIKTSGKTYGMLARPTQTSMADLFVLKEVFVHEAYAECLRHVADKPVRFVDIGGNIGAFSVWLARQRTVEQGFIFEPLESNLHLLGFNLQANHVKNVAIMPHALGGTTRVQKMMLNSSSPGGSSLYAAELPQNSNVQLVSVLALGEWLKDNPGPFDLLKMDCEGAEWEIIEASGTAAFQSFSMIVAEVHAGPDNRNVEEFKAFFEQSGFRTIRWDGRSHGIYVGVR